MQDKNRIEKIVSESIRSMIEAKEKGLILEISLPRKDYKDKVDDKIPQLLTNWCLVHYCTLANRETLKKHWQGELRGHFLTISRYAIKENDNPKKRLKVLEEIWQENDYNQEFFLSMTVCNKFIEKQIDISSDEYKQALKDCINATNDIFSLILLRDSAKIDEYVHEI